MYKNISYEGLISDLCVNLLNERCKSECEQELKDKLFIYVKTMLKEKKNYSEITSFFENLTIEFYYQEEQQSTILPVDPSDHPKSELVILLEDCPEEPQKGLNPSLRHAGANTRRYITECRPCAVEMLKILERSY